MKRKHVFFSCIAWMAIHCLTIQLMGQTENPTATWVAVLVHHIPRQGEAEGVNREHMSETKTEESVDTDFAALVKKVRESQDLDGIKSLVLVMLGDEKATLKGVFANDEYVKDVLVPYATTRNTVAELKDQISELSSKIDGGVAVSSLSEDSVSQIEDILPDVSALVNGGSTSVKNHAEELFLYLLRALDGRSIVDSEGNLITVGTVKNNIRGTNFSSVLTTLNTSHTEEKEALRTLLSSITGVNLRANNRDKSLTTVITESKTANAQILIKVNSLSNGILSILKANYESVEDLDDELSLDGSKLSSIDQYLHDNYRSLQTLITNCNSLYNDAIASISEEVGHDVMAQESAMNLISLIDTVKELTSKWGDIATFTELTRVLSTNVIQSTSNMADTLALITTRSSELRQAATSVGESLVSSFKDFEKALDDDAKARASLNNLLVAYNSSQDTSVRNFIQSLTNLQNTYVDQIKKSVSDLQSILPNVSKIEDRRTVMQLMELLVKVVDVSAHSDEAIASRALAQQDAIKLDRFYNLEREKFAHEKSKRL